MTLKKKVPLYAIVVAWLVGIAGTMVFMGHTNGQNAKPHVDASAPAAIAACDYTVKGLSGFGHVRPLLFAEPKCESPRYEALRSGLDSLIASAQRNGDVRRASMYVRDLETAEWFQINGGARYEPGSLMKVPTMLVKLMMAERDPSEAGRTYALDNEVPLPDQQFPPSHELEIGRKYGLLELLRYSIQYSSNRAELLLIKSAGEDRFRELLLNIGLPDFQSGANTYPISAAEYAQFMKALYHASVLSPGNAEFALDLLIHSDFDQGLRKGIPEGVDVASKFGESGIEGTSRQLHEAAIVYAEGHPYLIVVMTEGQNAPALASFLGRISGMVFHDMSAKPKA